MAKSITQHHILTHSECIELLAHYGLRPMPSEETIIKLMQECFRRGLNVDIMHIQAKKK